MKQTIYTLMTLVLIMGMSSCAKLDTYEAPAATLTGKIIDASTGQPIQTGPGDIQIRYVDSTWAKNHNLTVNQVSPQDFNVKPDGTFNNTKIFAGTYLVYPWNGPFVPHYSTDAVNPVNKRKVVNINEVTTVDFTVDPFLKIEWIAEPVLNVDKTVSVSFRFSRGTTNPLYQFDVLDAYLFIGETQFVSNGSFNPNLSNFVAYTGSTGTALMGSTVTLTSKLPLGANRTYYIRVGARTNDNIQKRYNYTSVKTVSVP